MNQELKRKKEELLKMLNNMLFNISKIKNETIKRELEKEVNIILEEKKEILSFKKYILEKTIFCNSDFYKEEEIINFFENEITEIVNSYRKLWNIKLLLTEKKMYKKNEKYFAKIKVIPKTSSTQYLSLNFENEEIEEDNYDHEKEYEKEREEDYILSLATQHRNMELISLQQKIEEEIKKQEKEKTKDLFR